MLQNIITVIIRAYFWEELTTDFKITVSSTNKTFCTIAVFVIDVVVLGFGAVMTSFCETLAATCDSIRRQNPGDHHHHPYRRENFKPHTFATVNLQTIFYATVADMITI
jgi:hypothetical protein